MPRRVGRGSRWALLLAIPAVVLTVVTLWGGVSTDGAAREGCEAGSIPFARVEYRSGHVQSNFEPSLRNLWSEAVAKGTVLYNGKKLPSRMVEHGQHRFDLVVNTARGKKRKTKTWSSGVSLKTPFDPNGFSFHKVDRSEVLSYFEIAESETRACRPYPPSDRSNTDHVLLANKFPLGPYSGILAPNLSADKPQRLDAQGVKLGIALAHALRSHEFRVGFNSLAAGASVNHLHLQFWWYHGLRSGSLPIELADTLPLAVHASSPDLRVSTLDGYQLQGVVFESTESAMDLVARAVEGCIEWMTEQEVPHNILISKDRSRLFIVPRRPTSKDTMIRGELPPGFPEICGQVIATSESHSNITGDELSHHFTTHLRLPSDRFSQLLDACIPPDSNQWHRL